MVSARDPVRDALKSLLEEVHARVVVSAEALAAHKRRTAASDTDRDQSLSELDAFPGAVEALRTLPQFDRAFGTEHGERATVQFVYDYLTRTDQLGLDEHAFDVTFEALTSELGEPDWTFVTFANLRNFDSSDGLIDFGDGVTIRHRVPEEIAERLGWTEWHLDHLFRDWDEGMKASGHVLWIESTLEKTPDKAILTDSATGVGKALNLLLALWLYAPGDVSLGALFTDTAAQFDLRGSGVGRSGGMPSDVWGRTYQLSSAHAVGVRAIYDDIVAFRKATDVPNNVRLAVRRFESVYSRGVKQREDRIVDELIALEALAGSGTELRFRLAFRVSSLLATGDDERLQIFDAVRDFYDIRSKIVHGTPVGSSERALVNDDEQLRALVRRLVKAAIFATAHTGFQLTASYVDRELDRALLTSDGRKELRTNLGLE
ncbi:MAG: hypothetical protein LC808_34575 [Actinobacteria bacterium]|nr:hypothetical protein [Actinomycetota bacterium]